MRDVRLSGRTMPDERDERVAAIQAHHGKICSCHMCGNPRKHWDEETIQELREKKRYGDRYSIK